jgi:CDP-paratose 2-epimerase
VGSVAVITGSAGLIGSEAARWFAGQGLDVIGIDNDLRAYFFGADGTTLPVREQL